jgi:hypothetical protein
VSPPASAPVKEEKNCEDDNKEEYCLHRMKIERVVVTCVVYVNMCIYKDKKRRETNLLESEIQRRLGFQCS